jgi:hypothetical protein
MRIIFNDIDKRYLTLLIMCRKQTEIAQGSLAVDNKYESAFKTFVHF